MSVCLLVEQIPASSLPCLCTLRTWNPSYCVNLVDVQVARDGLRNGTFALKHIPTSSCHLHMVTPPYLYLKHSIVCKFGHVCGLTKREDVLHVFFHGVLCYCIDIIALKWSGWRGVVYAPSFIKQGQHNTHARTQGSHGFDFFPLGFTNSLQFSPETQGLLCHTCLC